MERQPSEGMELCVSGVNLGFDNPSMRMEEDGDNLEGVLRDMPSNEDAGQSEGSTSMSNEVMPRFRSIQALYEAIDPIEEEWWRTTPVATKTRYHGAGGALLRARIYPLIFISLFLYYELFDPHVFKRVLVYFFSPFRLPGGFFPFRDPICESHPSL